MTPVALRPACFAGAGSWSAPAAASHMHSAKFSFPDADQVESAWTMWKDGAAGDTVRISLRREAN